MDNELWTISRMLQWTEQYFRSKGIESSRLDGEVLLSHSLGCDRMYLYVNFDRPLDKAELDAYRPLVVQRAKGYSVAAITGHKEFMGLSKYKAKKPITISLSFCHGLGGRGRDSIRRNM